MIRIIYCLMIILSILNLMILRKQKENRRLVLLISNMFKVYRDPKIQSLSQRRLKRERLKISGNLIFRVYLSFCQMGGISVLECLSCVSTHLTSRIWKYKLSESNNKKTNNKKL